jgi:hypothetical protein
MLSPFRPTVRSAHALRNAVLMDISSGSVGRYVQAERRPRRQGAMTKGIVGVVHMHLSANEFMHVCAACNAKIRQVKDSEFIE